MTVKMLEEYLSRKAEITEITKKLEELKADNGIVVSDTILDYRTGYGRPKAITGMSFERYSKLRSRYIAAIMRIQAECDEVEEYVELITDSLMRRIARMYFLEGKKQQQIAQLIHMDQSSVSKKLRKLLLEMEDDLKIQ